MKAAAAPRARLGNQATQNPPRGNERHSLQVGSVDRNHRNKGKKQNDDHLHGRRSSDSKESPSSPKEPARPDDAETASRLSDEIEKGSEPLPTEFSEAEKDFEPLYLREDEDYDVSEEQTTNPATSEPQTPTKKVPTEEQLRKLPTCPEIPPHLMGRLNISLDGLEKLRLNDVLKELEWVMPGGTWSPSYEPTNPCLPRHKVAVVLPYRDRLHHLIILLSWLHPILRRQQLEYTIYVAEQAGNATFNKGSIMNSGFMEAWQPRHLSVGVDTLGYKLPYFLLVGGVLSVRGDHFLRLNGYSNMYWGWGGEDDDMGYRIKQSGLSITRPPNMLARYTMIRHLKRRPLTWKVRGKLVRTSGRRYRLDGLNTLKYSLLALHKHPLFTHLLLDVGTPPENLVRLDSH
ncbi:beta-1,4-N-acetylgalactosaminyltransferase bre-4-like [Macrobrachium nipponense]|uniref:beta-1,4-N-acetylgalactosaminyltransferase bre-4-like n=1 Tax=Macrobrachium nipponense TaxID=159736 RepID=UPI0030C7D33F